MQSHRQSRKQPQSPEIVRPDSGAMGRAAEMIAQGRIVAIPTETVYGLAADAANEAAVQALYVAKGRPADKPFVVQFATREAAISWAALDGPVARLAQNFWPGPLTLIVHTPPKARLARRITAGGDTIGIRVPDNEIALGVLRAAARPLAVTSANLSGKPGARSVGEISRALKSHLALVLDGGRCPIGVASTVIDMTGDRFRILRQGTVSAEDIERALRP